MAKTIPILTFHALDDQPSVISFPPELFERAMGHLHDRGYQTLHLPEIIERVSRGLSFPERSFGITFDDGYRSVYDRAFLILRRYDFSATVFLTVAQAGSWIDSDRSPPMCDRTMLSWGEIREMQRYGIDFGAHTLTHPDLTRLSLKQAEREICESKAIIEEALGISVLSFAYPYGRYDDRCREIVMRHYVCACSDRLGMVDTRTDLYCLERVDTAYLRTERLFGLMSSVLFPMYIKARNVPRRFRRAVQSRRAY